MSPSINARWSEVESSLDFVAFRAVPTTLYPRARNARTIPAPMPCDAPVTITVLDELFIVTLIKNPHPIADRSVGLVLNRLAADRVPYQTRPGARVVTSWTSHVLPSGSLKDKNDP